MILDAFMRLIVQNYLRATYARWSSWGHIVVAIVGVYNDQETFTTFFSFVGPIANSEIKNDVTDGTTETQSNQREPNHINQSVW